MAYISCTNSTSSSLTVTVGGMSDSPKRVDYYYLKGSVSSPSSGTYVTYQDIGTKTSTSFTYGGLQSGTTYTLYVKVFNTTTGAQLGFSEYWTSGTTSTPSVAYWTWDDQNYSDGANAIFVRAARDAVNQRNKCSLFRHTVWNDLVRKTKEMRAAKGESPVWNTRYATEEETKMGPAEEDRKLTSKKFNSLRYNIGLVESTGITEEMCAPGEPVKGEYFMILTAALNRAIEKYT